MSSAPQPTSTPRAASPCTGPLQTVLAALAVFVLYWAVGINETPASASGATSHGVHVRQVANTTTLGSTVATGQPSAGQERRAP